MKKNAFWKDIGRSIKNSKMRFLSLMMITVLGVAVLTGIYAACQDMYRSADLFYDEQNLFDVQILSTLGLTDEDVAALAAVEGIETAAGVYSETVHTEAEGSTKDAELTALNTAGLNNPYLLEGELPGQSGQIAVTRAYLEDTGKSIGDTVIIEEMMDDDVNSDIKENSPGEEDEALEDDFNLDIDWDDKTAIEEESEIPNFPVTEFTICGVVLDPMDISNKGISFRTTATSDYTFFITGADASYDVYTSVYVTLTGLSELNCYSEEYDDAVQEVIGLIEKQIMAQRQEARYNEVLKEALDKITDAENTMNEAFADADQQIADAWADIADAKKELTDGEATLTEEEKDALQQLADARAEIQSSLNKLNDAQAELDDNAALLADGRAELEKGKDTLAQQKQSVNEQLDEARLKLESSQNELDTGLIQLQEQLPAMQSVFDSLWPQAEWDAYVNVVTASISAGNSEDEAATAAAAEQAVLFQALSEAYNTITGGLTQQLNQTQLELDSANQTAADIEYQLAAAQTTVQTAQTALQEKQAAVAAAQSDLDSAYAALEGLTEGSTEYNDQLDIIAQAQEVLDSAGLEADTAARILQEAQTEEAGWQEQKKGQMTLIASYTEMISQLEGQLAALAAQPELPLQVVQAAFALGRIQGGQQVLTTGKAAFEQQKQEALSQLDQAEATLTAKEAELASAESELAAAQQQIDQGLQELRKGEEALNKEEETALAELADAWRELEQGKEELSEAEETLKENEETYLEKRTEAEETIADAYEKLENIKMTEWYVQDRSALDSYSSLKSDMSSIESVGNAFPILFLVVAILISLTTMTRMVEEERSLIGTYKALGFSNSAVYTKYLFYAFAACLAGGIIGDLTGFVVLPLILINILQVLYSIPDIHLSFDAFYGIGGVLLFMISIVLSTAVTCRKELAQTPAALMRPKAPKAGTRIILERITFIWKRLSFLNKVTARNLFRYKKRLFMTVFGIMGCTALVLAGFAIKDSVTELMPKQYEQIYHYDLMVVVSDDDNDAFIEKAGTNTSIADYLNLRIDSFKLSRTGGDNESVQLLVIPDDGSIEDYIRVQDTNGEAVGLSSKGIFITQNAAEILGVEPGDTVILKNSQLARAEANVEEIVQNYLGNNVYITQELYESLFGEYLPNAILAHLSENVTDAAAYGLSLLDDELVLSASSTEGLKADFSSNFKLINYVVYILIILAAGLAFVVLFTLSSTNISERIRELATIKVLGFFDREVHAYVDKETLLLTLLGVLLGLPLGRFVSGLLTAALKMPSLYFEVYVSPGSYLIAAVLSFSFALIVNVITDRTLNHIDMVEALKSVE